MQIDLQRQKADEWLPQTGGLGKDGHKTFGYCENVWYLNHDHRFMGVSPYQNVKCVQFMLHKLYLSKVVKERTKKGLIDTVEWMNCEIIVLRGRTRQRINSTYCMTSFIYKSRKS